MAFDFIGASIQKGFTASPKKTDYVLYALNYVLFLTAFGYPLLLMFVA